MDIYNIEAFVIRAVDYGETSKILTLFSRNNGVISVMAKGVKNPKSKKFILSSLFTEANFELKKRGEFYYLKDGEIINANLEIRNKVDKIYLVQLFFDIIERTIVNNDDENIYLLLKKTIYFLIKTEDLIRLANMFLIKYISMIGFKPNLSLDSSKGKEHFFSIDEGRIVNKNSYNKLTVKLNDKEINYLKQILIDILENNVLLDNSVDQNKIFKLIIDFISYNLDFVMPPSYYNFARIKGIE